jgi:hypothetical protein
MAAWEGEIRCAEAQESELREIARKEMEMGKGEAEAAKGREKGRTQAGRVDLDSMTREDVLSRGGEDVAKPRKLLAPRSL